MEDIRSNLANKTFTYGVFYTVNHNILLSKLRYYGIRDVAINWLSSYLCERQQQVTLNDVASSFLNVNCGVPQVSILGPL